MEFQKTALKVMLTLGALLALAYVVTLAGEYVTEPLKRKIVDSVAGMPIFDCIKDKSITLNDAMQRAAQSNPDVEKAQNKVDFINGAILACQIGLLYLFSCFIVRFVGASKSNQSLKAGRRENPRAP